MDSPPFLEVNELTGLEPLDRQFGVQPRKFVPDRLREELFDAPAFIRPDPLHSGTDVPVPQMNTYLVIDASAFPDWAEERMRLDLTHRCLFTGDAEEELGHAAPWLVALSDDDDFTRRLFTWLDGYGEQAQVHHWHRPFGIFIRSHQGFDAVFNHLRRFTKLQAINGKWYFRRFWEARHCYFWLPLLKDGFQIAARFFGRTAASETAMLHSISVLNGPQGEMVTAIWNDDALLESTVAAALPKTRTQVLDSDYQVLLDEATRQESLEKIVDHLIQIYPQRYGPEVVPRPQVREFARDIREEALRLGCTTELGWARFATIATHLGIGFLNDPRFASRGLSYQRIGHDSQGEKILTIGRECAKPLIVVKKRLVDEAARGALINIAPIDRTIPGIMTILRQIDPICDWTWGEAVLTEWAKQFLTISQRASDAGHCLPAEVALAYYCGLAFRWDRSLGYEANREGAGDRQHDMAVKAIFDNIFGVS